MDAVGPMSLALETCRSQFAACASYRSFLGAATSAAAVARTYLAALPEPADGKEYTPEEFNATLRPFSVLSTAASNGYGIRVCSVGGIIDSGRIFVWLEIAVPTAYLATAESEPVDLTRDLELGDRWINNMVGQILWEFAELGSRPTPGRLRVTSVDVRMGPCRESPEETIGRGAHYGTLIEVGWGAE